MAGLGLGLGVAEFLDNSRDPYLVLDLNYAVLKSLGTRESFSRASSGTYFNASGVLTSAGINVARFDHVYNGTSWISRGLLVEEQRTNVLTNSENFTAWTLSNTTRSNSGTTPQGTVATLITGAGSSGWKAIYNLGAGSVTGQYVYSVCAKAGTHSIVQIALTGSDTGGWVNFDLSNQTYSVQGTGTTTAAVKQLSNGWLLISMIRTITSSSDGIQITLVDSLSATRSASTSSTGNFSLAFCQIESGSFPTSYIPTTSSSVTRSADVCQITGSDFAGIWNAIEGSFVAEYDFLAAPADRVSPRVWYVSDGAYTNGAWVQSGTTDGFYVYQSGAPQAALTATALGSGISSKMASSYKLNDFAASFNGAAVLTDTSGNVPTVNRLEIGYMSDISGRVLNGHIARLRYYNARLTNARLQELST